MAANNADTTFQNKGGIPLVIAVLVSNETAENKGGLALRTPVGVATDARLV
jgi:hypothetical protein